ncbi:HNH endonuclease signature motif containing protein [Pseudactinotalea suaedae]
MVTDPLDRTVLEVSRDVYEPPPAMAALVRAREPECVHPACSVSSDGCDLHHRIPWPVGLTCVANLDPGCRRDHVLLTHGGWSYVTDADGRRTWTTAAGLVYVEDANGNLTRRKPKRPGEPRRPHDDGPPPF